MKAGLTAAAIGCVAVLVGGSVMLGCPGTLENKECFLQERAAHDILAASCTAKSCHNAEDEALGLDLETSGLGSRLSGKASTSCDGKLLVDPGNPEESVLYGKLLDTPVCGSRMPLGQPPLFEEDIEIVRLWIAGMDGSCANAGAGGAGGAGKGGAGGAPAGGAGGTGPGGAGGMSTGGAGGAGTGGTGGM